jgi:hypothetical protein
MTMTLPFQPLEEARLAAQAQAKGVSTDTLLRVAIDKILADAPDQPDAPDRESRPIWEVILANMKDVPARNLRSCRKTGQASMTTISTRTRDGINTEIGPYQRGDA